MITVINTMAGEALLCDGILGGGVELVNPALYKIPVKSNSNLTDS